MRNAIPRRAGNLNPYRLAINPGHFIFWPFFAKNYDTTPCKKSENLRKFQVIDISQKIIVINYLAC